MRVIEVEVVKLSPHPLSLRIFGSLPDDELADLAEDIRNRGIQYPLEVDDQHRVLCGSQRLKVAVQIGMTTVPAIFRQFASEEDLEEHLVRDNLHRRHLTPRQRYLACRELERIEAVKARARMGNHKVGEPSRAQGTARKIASKEAGVSEATYERLKRVYESGNRQVQEDLDTGKISVTAAAEKVSASRLRARRLPGDDPRAHALRLVRLRREGNRLAKYLKLHPLEDYGQHRQEAAGLAGGWAEALKEWAS